MKYQDEFRDKEKVLAEAGAIAKIVTRPWRIMEVCGGQTHAFLRYGLVDLLPDKVTLLHGPGCPVCVTPTEVLDGAVALAEDRGVLLCSFGDMLRVPGSKGNLFQCRARGGNVKIVYSPLEAVQLAEENPQQEVVFLAVGFETTAPANALAVLQAQEKGIKNFSLLVSHYLVPPALKVIMNNPNSRVEGFLAAGHVCTIMGESEYLPLVSQYQIPIVITGFEPLDLMQGIRWCVEALEVGQPALLNQYARSVKSQGNLPAREAISKVFYKGEQNWRGLGVFNESGLILRKDYQSFDAWKKFNLDSKPELKNSCRSGEVLMGTLEPTGCAEFGKTCTPENPLGAPMVSAEGACAAYFKYGSPTQRKVSNESNP